MYTEGYRIYFSLELIIKLFFTFYLNYFYYKIYVYFTDAKVTSDVNNLFFY